MVVEVGKNSHQLAWNVPPVACSFTTRSQRKMRNGTNMHLAQLLKPPTVKHVVREDDID
jgi:hypothetical protein